MDSDPVTFLTTASIDERIDRGKPKHNTVDGHNYNHISIEIAMTNTKWIHKREAYTIFNLLEDFGGFTGSIVMVFSFVMSFYSERMYQDSISKERPLQSASFSPDIKRMTRTLFHRLF